MAVQRVVIGGSDRRSPAPGGPVAEVVIGAAADQPVGVVHVTLPAGGGMPAHDHGTSAALLIPLSGEIRLVEPGEGDRVTDLAPGSLGSIPVGQLVAVANQRDGEARLLVVLTPPDFAANVAKWPLVEG